MAIGLIYLIGIPVSLLIVLATTVYEADDTEDAWETFLDLDEIKWVLFLLWPALLFGIIGVSVMKFGEKYDLPKLKWRYFSPIYMILFFFSQIKKLFK